MKSSKLKAQSLRETPSFKAPTLLRARSFGSWLFEFILSFDSLSFELSARSFGLWILSLSLSGELAALAASAGEPPAWHLRATTQVDAAGIYFDQLVAPASVPIPPGHIRLAPAPSAGQTVTFNRAQINELIQQHAPELATTNWTGAAQIKVTRRTRALDEAEIKTFLTTTLQRDFVKEKGELELRFMRPWNPVTVVDEPLTLKVLDLPAAGVTPNFIVRFELVAGMENVGNWQVDRKSVV